MAETRLYGVSTGDGNNGVSHMFADYYVRTDRPWTLAQLALLAQFKPEYQAQAADEMDVDGEAEYTISAVLYEPLDREESDEDDESSSYCDANGAWFILEVFPEDEPRDGRPIYDSIEDALTLESDVMRKIAAEEC